MSKATGVKTGEAVVITMNPAVNYELSTLVVDGKDVTSEVKGNRYEFAMPDKDITAAAAFKKADGPYSVINATASNANGTISFSKSSGLYAGDKVTVTISPAAGYSLASLIVDTVDVTSRVSGSSYEITMPERSIAVAAAFRTGGIGIYSITDDTDPTAHGTITISPSTGLNEGDTVTITVNPESNYRLNTLTVDGERVRVSNNVYTFSMPAKNISVEATFSRKSSGGSGGGGGGSSSGGSTTEPTNPANPTDPANPSGPSGSGSSFSDVASDAYYKDAVDWAVEKGITNGTTATTFSPENSCTRAQMVTFLWRAAGSPEPSSSSNPFTDIDMSLYYGKAVLWAVEKGITNGMTPTEFGPDNTVDRGQTVTFIYRAAGQPSVSGGSSQFADVDAGQYYADAVSWAVSKSVTNGVSATEFGADQDCTRGQIVTLLYRYYTAA